MTYINVLNLRYRIQQLKAKLRIDQMETMFASLRAGLDEMEGMLTLLEQAQEDSQRKQGGSKEL